MNADPIYALIAAAPVTLAILLLAERMDLKWLRGAAKMATSSLFILVGWLGFDPAGDIHPRLVEGIMAGLALSWLGDALLLSHHRKAFLAGIVAFLLAHIAYAIAFVGRGMDWTWAIVAAVVLVPVVAVASRWILPHAGRLRIPVAIYMVAISAMVVTAVGTFGHERHWLILAGALLFYASDLAVARHRFIQPGFVNRAWGLPAYYAGQFMLAWSIVTI